MTLFADYSEISTNEDKKNDAKLWSASTKYGVVRNTCDFFFYSKSLKTRVVTKQNFFLSLLNYRNVDLVYTCLSSNACFAIIVLVQIFVWTVNTYKIRIKLLE